MGGEARRENRVNPSQMNEMPGPLASPKPHHLQSQSTDLLVFSEPKVIIASSRGSTGGSDPAMLELDDGGDVFLLGPLDLTTMAWYRAADESWDPLARAKCQYWPNICHMNAVKDLRGAIASTE